MRGEFPGGRAAAGRTGITLYPGERLARPAGPENPGIRGCFEAHRTL